MKGDHCIVHVKNPKSNNKEGDFVDLFTVVNQSCCPVKCITGLYTHSVTDMNTPVFKFETGKLLTPAKLNTIIRNLLHNTLGQAALQYSSHSLRAAIPSALARFPELARDEDVMGWGRWDSTAFRRYTRLQEDRKRTIYGKISKAVFCRPTRVPGRGRFELRN